MVKHIIFGIGVARRLLTKSKVGKKKILTILGIFT